MVTGLVGMVGTLLTVNLSHPIVVIGFACMIARHHLVKGGTGVGFGRFGAFSMGGTAGRMLQTKFFMPTGLDVMMGGLLHVMLDGLGVQVMRGKNRMFNLVRDLLQDVKRTGFDRQTRCTKYTRFTVGQECGYFVYITGHL